ncbi:hypothetical protein [Streptomyces longwoodensis]|uniref:hypothetical protein n=1 Tax=Streptomyces longwoodensis TaxID=68231 RepID=UPI0036EA7CAE
MRVPSNMSWARNRTSAPAVRRRTSVTGGLTLALLATLAVPAFSAPTAAGVPVTAPCPADLADAATCYTGRSADGAHYAIAVPKEWNDSLVVHAHGGPDLGEESDPERSVGDLGRWSVMVEQGYAWAGSSYRRGGYGTRMAAADTEALRRLFVENFRQPRRTYLHGQSWGGDVAAKTAEVYGAKKNGPYDGVLPTNGVLGGGSRGYDYRVDLRVVYQYYCRNHPRPDEVRYPLWKGLRPDSTMTTAGLRARLQECTGFSSSPGERTAVQQRNLDDILAVTRIPERTLESHLRFATFTFRDMVHNRLGDRNPFSNEGVVYSGSHDDAALNAGVERFSSDPSAVRDLSYDSDLTGKVSIPVLTLHAIDDPTAFVEHEAAYRATLHGAQRDKYLVQTFTDEHEHSGLSTSEYANSLSALDTWVRSGKKPTAASVAASCPAFDARYGTGCLYRPSYVPPSYATRVNARPGGLDWPALTARQEKEWSRLPMVGIAP